MNEFKQKTVFEERDEAIWLMNKASMELNKAKVELDELRRNYDRVRAAFEKQTIEKAELRNQLAATEEALAQVQRESAELREKYETHCGYWDGPLMKIARAAIAYRMVDHVLERIPAFSDVEAVSLLMDASENAIIALEDAITEYRALTEPPPLSPSKQAAIDRGIAKAEKIGEMWEKN